MKEFKMDAKITVIDNVNTGTKKIVYRGFTTASMNKKAAEERCKMFFHRGTVNGKTVVKVEVTNIVAL